MLLAFHDIINNTINIVDIEQLCRKPDGLFIDI